MSGDEIRVLERRSRIVAHELRSKRIELGVIDQEIRGARERVDGNAARFSVIKEALLRTGLERSPRADRRGES